MLLHQRCFVLSNQALALKMSNLATRTNMTNQAVAESGHPIEDAQEEELNLYKMKLSKLLLETGGEYPLTCVTMERWAAAESCLMNLESYLKDHKIGPEQVRKTDICGTMIHLLRSMEALDKAGIDGKMVDVTLVERVWGMVDKIGSGLSYLLQVDKRTSAVEHVSRRSHLNHPLSLFSPVECDWADIS